MTNEERIQAKTIAAEQVAFAVRDLMRRLHVEAELPWDSIIAGCHGEVMTAMLTRYGGKVAAESAIIAAAQVRDMPSLADVQLASTPPAGRA